MRILNFGSMNLDYVYQVPHFVRPGETLAANEQKVHAGGKGLNQSIALARAGALVYHAGALGKGGDPLLNLLEKSSVDTTYIKRVDCLQGNTVIQVNDSGENCILLFGGSNHAITKSQIDETIGHFNRDDYLVAQNEISNLAYLIERASSVGMKIIFNPSPYDSSLEAIDYSKIDWLLINEIEGSQITGQKDVNAICQIIQEKFPKLKVVLTLGNKGSLCLCGDKVIKQSVYEVETVDTTAAGDTFTGFFIANLATGKSLEDCMKRAAKASAIAVSRPGASISIPTAQEVENIVLYDKEI